MRWKFASMIEELHQLIRRTEEVMTLDKVLDIIALFLEIKFYLKNNSFVIKK